MKISTVQHTAFCLTTKTQNTLLRNKKKPKSQIMTDMIPLLASAFTLGLLGAGHCLGMCGGLMGALTLSIPEAQRHKRSRIIIGYNLGRVCSYAIAGFLFGLLGWAVEQTPAAMAMRVIAGLLLISLGL